MNRLPTVNLLITKACRRNVMKIKSYMKKTGILVLFTALLFGCTESTKLNLNLSKKITEATIDYDVSFPYIESDGLSASFLPDKMTMTIKGDQYRTQIKTYGGIFKSLNIVDSKEKKFTQMLKIFKKKVTCDMSKDEMLTFKDDFPKFTLIPSTETKVIAGIECKKVTGVFHDLNTPDIIIYYTDKFKITDPNWCNPFSEIDGVMLAYEIEQFDTRARIVASNISYEKVKDETIQKETGFKEVHYDVLKIEFEKIMDSFSI